MNDPHRPYEPLYELADDVPDLAGVVLIHALDGFIDAGSAARAAREQMLRELPHRPLATFDVDGLLDYRSRRPLMTFVEDHWEDYPQPRLVLHEVTDTAGTPFLLLTGPEPDFHWERFVGDVRRLVDRFGVRLTVGLNAIPMAVPHTRPVGVTAHATRKDLVTDYRPWIGTVMVPASVGHLLEWRLGQDGRDAMGFAVHVPHYLAQTEFPAAAEALLDSVSRATGLALPTAALREAAQEVRAQVDTQVAESEEAQAVVSGLEQQYDAVVSARGREGLLAAEGAPLPTAEELGAELERFLAEQARRRDRPDS